MGIGVKSKVTEHHLTFIGDVRGDSGDTKNILFQILFSRYFFVYDDPAYTSVVTELKAELKRLREFYGDSDELAQKLLQEDMERRQKR